MKSESSPLKCIVMENFACALGNILETIAENAGLSGRLALQRVWSSHASGNTKAGIDIETGQSKDLSLELIYDLYNTKWYGMKGVCNICSNILKINHNIVAKV